MKFNWTEDHRGIWEMHANGFDYVVTDDGNFSIHFGGNTEKERVVLLIETCRRSVNDMKRDLEAHAIAVTAAIDAACAKDREITELKLRAANAEVLCKWYLKLLGEAERNFSHLASMTGNHRDLTAIESRRVHRLGRQSATAIRAVLPRGEPTAAPSQPPSGQGDSNTSGR